MDLTGLGVERDSERARRLARDLWRALNHIREVRPEELPDRAQLRPGQTSFIYFPRPFNDEDETILERIDIGDGLIAFERAPDGRWLFSAETLRTVSTLSRSLSALPIQVAADEAALDEPGWVRELVPPALRAGGFMGMRHWQWVGLLALIFVGIVLDFTVRSLLVPTGRTLLARFGTAVDRTTLQQSVRALGLFVAALFWSATVGILRIGAPAGGVADAAVGFFAVLAGTVAGWRLADLSGAILMQRAERTASKFDDILIPLVRKTLKIFIVALGVFYGAQHLNINIVPLLTGLGIGGLAFAFAAKDTIENLFGSVAVVLDRPFEVGDWVVVGDIEGTIEELGFRSTRIRTFYNSLVTMPNAALVRATVDNYGRRRYRRWKTYIGVQYDTTPEQLLAFTEGIRELVRQHPYTRKDYYQVWANDFADSSLNILVYVFHEVPDWSTELRERERLFIDIVRLADRLGVQFAFPTRTVHLYTEEHAPPSVRHAVPQGTHDQEARATGVGAARDITADRPWRERRPGPVQFDLDGTAYADREVGGDE
jgi:MscS family membrane protein